VPAILERHLVDGLVVRNPITQRVQTLYTVVDIGPDLWSEVWEGVSQCGRPQRW
jgi:hypothetical protein